MQTETQAQIRVKLKSKSDRIDERMDEVLAQAKKHLGGAKDDVWATLAVAAALNAVAEEISELRSAIENSE